MSFTSFLISVLTVLMSVFMPLGNVKPEVKETDFVPVLRFTVQSDAHVGAPFDKECKKIREVIRAGYDIAGSNEYYDSLDAVIFAGDNTDNGKKLQFMSFIASVNSELKDNTRFLGVVAKSHDGYTIENMPEYWEGLTGLNSDYHEVINGYHFIGISRSKDSSVHYSEDQLVWLREQLETAADDDPAKPIFVVHHEHNSDTVYGSLAGDGWGVDYFKDILAEYPQVIDFSGHSHYPLNDPRSIWQGDFTCVGTGALYYSEFTVDGQNCIHPENNHTMEQMWSVEVDASNRVRLTGYDMVSGKIICEYIINSPADSQSFEYTPEKQAERSSAPVFGDGAKVSVGKLLNKVTVKFDAATPTDGYEVFLYRVTVRDAAGNVAASETILNDYWYMPVSESFTTGFAMPEDGVYTVSVTAENAYGMSSQPITAVFEAGKIC